MSALGRLCLRLAACAALRNATMVGENVFDSRVEAVDLSDDAPVAAAIAVYTEQDEGEALSAQNGGPPFVPEVELILEITMMTREIQASGAIVVGAPATDDQLEASVDLIEAQAEIALFASYAPNAVLFRRVAKRPKQKQSLRFTDPKSSTRLAIRYVTYRIEIDDRPAPIYDATQTGLNRLPEPFRTIAMGWGAGPELDTANAVAAALAGATPASLLGVIATTAPPPSTQTPGAQPEPSRAQTWTLPG